MVGRDNFAVGAKALVVVVIDSRKKAVENFMMAAVKDPIYIMFAVREWLMDYDG